MEKHPTPANRNQEQTCQSFKLHEHLVGKKQLVIRRPLPLGGAAPRTPQGEAVGIGPVVARAKALPAFHGLSQFFTASVAQQDIGYASR